MIGCLGQLKINDVLVYKDKRGSIDYRVAMGGLNLFCNDFSRI